MFAVRLFLLCVILVTAWQPTVAVIVLETGSVTFGVEMTLTEWYGESLYSINTQHHGVVSDTGDNKCKTVTSAVIAALARKQHIGLLTEEQEARALERFQACLGKLCNNSAMLDSFMKPQTLREQVDLLVATAKLADIFRGKEDGEILLNLLVDGELKKILSEVPYPPKFPDGNVTLGLLPYAAVGLRMLAAACAPGLLTVDTLDMPVITEVLISSLNDRYTRNAISAKEVASVWNMKTVEEYENLWKGIAEKVASPTSALSETCLDPAVAYFNYEKIAISRIKQIAVGKGFCVSKDELGPIPDVEKSFEMVSPDDSSLYEISYGSYEYAAYAPPPISKGSPPSGGTDNAPPADSGGSNVAPPAAPAPSFDGPPV